MIKTKLAGILSLNGVSLIIGITGFIMALVNILVEDNNFSLNIKWFFFLLYIFITVLLISFRLSYLLYIDLKNNNQITSSAISYIELGDILLVENNKFLDYSVMTTIFYSLEGVERELAVGYVLNVQDKFTQIKIVNFDDNFLKYHPDIIAQIGENKASAMRNIVVKNHIKFK